MRHVVTFLLAAIVAAAGVVAEGSGAISAGPRQPPVVVRPVVRTVTPPAARRAVRATIRAAAPRPVRVLVRRGVRHIAVLHSPAPRLGTMEIGPTTQVSPSIVVAPSPAPVGACPDCPNPNVVQLNVVQVPL